ncbi:extracellular solute-binding protein [Pseudodesulfovibrio thermohalotolerans]|uniref:extracellular solute-binding protein n=1 Tax=Pseudodesulfovibrio thermohalotolerans TaxID=2880651 RepID=UPI0024435103|nr:extracellular solute-binding protein [Pseudodesulfovibrio thermohalotolerans]WFS63073.1 extracellular solute-binding protein [Pseudodesulfovibrio thermohalotolerans]
MNFMHAVKRGVFALLIALLPAVAMASGAQLEEKVVVYSTHGESMLELVADEFEAATGVKVEFINLKGELADRVRAEKANPQSDVMYGAPSSVYQELKAEDLFDRFTPAWADNINPLFKDKEGYWYGTIQTPVLMFYNTEMMSKADAPKDWWDLADPRYKGLIVSRNALSSSARATYSALLQQFDKKGDLDDGWKFLKGMDANVKRYYGSGSLQYQAVGRKEAAVSFAVLNSVIDNKIKNKMPLEIIDAKSGSPVITDGIAVIKGAKHPNAARAFVEFTGGAKVQALLANKFNRMPTLPEALAAAPKWMSEISFRVMDVDWGALAAKQSQWMQYWDSEIKDSAKDKK